MRIVNRLHARFSDQFVVTRLPTISWIIIVWRMVYFIFVASAIHLSIIIIIFSLSFSLVFFSRRVKKKNYSLRHWTHSNVRFGTDRSRRFNNESFEFAHNKHIVLVNTCRTAIRKLNYAVNIIIDAVFDDKFPLPYNIYVQNA